MYSHFYCLTIDHQNTPVGPPIPTIYCILRTSTKRPNCEIQPERWYGLDRKRPLSHRSGLQTVCRHSSTTTTDERPSAWPQCCAAYRSRYEFMLSFQACVAQCYIRFYWHYGCHRRRRRKSSRLSRTSACRRNRNGRGQTCFGSAKGETHRGTRWSSPLNEPWLEAS